MSKLLSPQRFLIALFLLACSRHGAYADTITFTLNDPFQTADPGSTLSFSATIGAPAANTDPIYLNGDSSGVTAPLPITIDDTPYFTNFPVSLNPGDSASDALFVASVPVGEPSGKYLGYFTLLGGSDADAQDIIAYATFDINVTAATGSPTPEPSDSFLFALGVLSMGMILRRRVR